MSKKDDALKLALELARDVRANADARLAAKAIALTNVIDAALAEQSAQQQCEYCKRGLKAGVCYCKPAQPQEPLGYITGFEWKTRQTEAVVKITRDAQPQHDFVHALYTSPQPAQQQEPVDNLDAFKAYLAECDDCLVEPDVAGAFNAGWKAASNQQPQQEPVAWTDEDFTDIYVSKDIAEDMGAMIALSLYQSPHSKPLTQEHIERIFLRYGGDMMNCARAIEREHGIKGDA